MIFENVITAICFSAIVFTVGYFAVNFIIKDRAGRIKYLRSFKRGKCIVVFLIAIPLFFAGINYGSDDVLTSVFESLSLIFDFIVLKIDLGNIRGLMDANAFYAATVYVCVAVVFANAILFTLSVAGQQLWRLFRSLRRKFSHKSGLLVLGYNKNSLDVCDSGKNFCVTVADKLSKEEALELYIKNIGYVSCDNFTAAVDKTVCAARNPKRKFTVVVNTGSDEKNLEICRLFDGAIEKCTDAERMALFDNLRVFVFGNPQYETLYEEVVKKSYGCIRLKNKYRMISMQFIDKYPFSSFMDERHIDYSTALIKRGVKINVCMIGFGKTNRQVFLTSVANNQFLCRKGDELAVKPVNYYIFDKNPSEENMNLNHSINRFKNEFSGVKRSKRKTEEYLPLPPPCANDKYFRMDINSPEFYSDIMKCCRGKNSVNFIIISYGSDLENIDLARKLSEKRKEWGLRDLTIFVKVRSPQKNYFLLDDCGCRFIGNERRDVYNIDEIVGDKIYRMAQRRNELYDLEKRLKQESGFTADGEAVVRREANRKWFLEKSQLERESSLYCCLSLRSKLNLIGLDYCGKEENGLPALTEEQFLDRYADGDKPDVSTLNKIVNGRKIINYTLNYVPSKRRNFAELEHARWNAFMLSKGIIPASKKLILNETCESDGEIKHTDGKNYELRRHGNLTTFEGLKEFAKMTAKRDGVGEEAKDVIKYDYQIMDDAYWLLSENGYKIVEKT